MNTDTGAIYTTPFLPALPPSAAMAWASAMARAKEAIEAARARGEPVVPVSARVVHLVRLGSQAEARAREKAKRKRKRKQAAQSRRRNRR